MVGVYIEQVVVISSLGVRLWLNDITKLTTKNYPANVRDIEYRPEVSAGLNLRLRQPRATITLYTSGKLVCTGCRSENDAKLALQRVLQILAEKCPEAIEGPLPEKLEINIGNVTCSAKLETPIGCGIIQRIFPTAEASRFGGGTINISFGEGKIRIFPEGQIVGVGFKSVKTALDTMTETIEKIRIGCKQYDSVRQEVCKLERFDPAVNALRKYHVQLSLKPIFYLEAHRILQDYSQKLIKESFRHTPEAVAAGALYAACLLQGNFLTQKNVAEASGLTEVTIRGVFQSINEVLELGIGDIYRYRKKKGIQKSVDT